jgi:hypothetical protein
MREQYNRRERSNPGLHPFQNGGGGGEQPARINDGVQIAGEVGPRLYGGGAFFFLLLKT